MYLLTEWEGRTGKYLARGQDVQTKCSKVCASWPRAKYFPIWPDLTHSISILSYDHYFFHFHCLVEQGRSGAVRISSRAIRVFPALSLWRVLPSYRTFFLMVFQGNCSWGRTGHMIIFVTNCLLTESEVLKGNSQTDREREQAQYGKAEVWDFPAKTQRLRLISCLLI